VSRTAEQQLIHRKLVLSKGVTSSKFVQQYATKGETMLKHSLLTAALAGMLISGASLAMAQSAAQSDNAASPSQAQGQERSERHHHQMDPAKRVEHLTKKLNLSAEQQSKIQGLLKDEQSQMQNLRQDTSTSKEDRRSKFMEVHKNTDDQIRATLNPDQQKKWDEMQSKREERMAKHHGGTDQGNGNSQPQ
jgi:periplasmic protein CpxP/Spy